MHSLMLSALQTDDTRMTSNQTHRFYIPIDELRKEVAESLGGAVKAYRLPAAAEKLGLAPGTEDEAFKSKRMYVLKRIESWSEPALLELAAAIIATYPGMKLADLVAELKCHADFRLARITRRDILNALDEVTPLFGDRQDEPFQMLEALSPPWDTSFGPIEKFRSLKNAVEQHYIRDPEDWSNSDLLKNCGALDCYQVRFFRLIETLLHPLSRRGESQQELVSSLNKLLKRDGFAAAIVAYESGYPIYAVQRVAGGNSGRVKHIIFASTHKPDLRFRDAINGDIEVVTHADEVLVYDSPIGRDGMKWSDLQSWWSEKQQIGDATSAKDSLYRRLRDCLPKSSPPQLNLFRAFFASFGPSIPNLPALLPEVWLHWDPKTVRERGVQVLMRFRMDFLMLLPHGNRVVIEVDGRHHYASESGMADPSLYASMMAADRELRLSGYEVYRFGASELQDDKKAERIVKTFFDDLFRRHNVTALPIKVNERN